MKQFVVYTVLTGGYDDINQPLVIDERFDYVLFTDNAKSNQIGVWKVRTIPYACSDMTRLSRYPKMHPHELLSEYEASLYVDANIQITGQQIYNRCVELYCQNVDWASVKHPLRDCIYDEAYVAYGLDTEDNISRWCHRLRQEGYPRHRGLFENGITYRRHNIRTQQVNELWWNLYEQYTRRDQLTLYYALWKMSEVKIATLLPEGESAAQSGTVQMYTHQDTAKQKGRRSIKESFWEHIRNRCRTGIEEKADSFREFHYWLYGVNPILAKTLLNIWGIYVVVVYGIIIKYRTHKKHKMDRVTHSN